MNPRILKKLSKRADPHVHKLTHLMRFKTEKGDDIETSFLMDLKSRNRWKGKPCEFGFFTAKKGTVGYGETTGFDDPDWQELDAYSHLVRLLSHHFTDWERWDNEGYPDPSIKLSNPAIVFSHVNELLTAHANQG